MRSPVSRVFALLEILQRNALTSGAELAARLEVDRRTLRRYVETLQSLGIPVVAQRGRDGGYRLRQGFKLPPMMFTNDEAIALVVGLRSAGDFGLANTRAASASALAKLERVMPEGIRDQVRAIESAIVVRARAATNTPTDPAMFATLSMATKKQQRIRFAYQDRGQTRSEREVDPFGLAFLDGNWYVVGYCRMRKGMRSFRLDRIRDVESLPVSFGRDPDFNALEFLIDSIKSLPRIHAVSVLLHANAETVRGAIFGALGVLEPVADGTRLRSRVDDLSWMARQLAALPFDFTVLEPQALHEAVKAHAMRLVRDLERPSTKDPEID